MPIQLDQTQSVFRTVAPIQQDQIQTEVSAAQLQQIRDQKQKEMDGKEISFFSL